MMYFSLAPRVGFEPTTCRLTAGCSTTELSRNMLNFFSSSRCFFASSQLDIAILAHIINIVNCFFKIFKKFFFGFFLKGFLLPGAGGCARHFVPASPTPPRSTITLPQTHLLNLLRVLYTINSPQTYTGLMRLANSHKLHTLNIWEFST